MNIYINETKIDYKPLFPLSWGSFFQKLLQNSQYIPSNHGIVKIQVDGLDSLNVMMDHSDQLVPEYTREIRIATKDSVSITRDGLGRVIALIESIKSEIAMAADLYREGNIKEASSKVTRIMEAFKPMINFINSVGISFAMNFDHLMFNATTSVKEKIESFLKTFQDLLAAQEKRDFVELADYLEYQLIDDMADWNTIANVLLKEVEASIANNA
ncbi:MAG: hypothetical protein ACM3SY_11770 [Candidatus Omnitrophota bacterium]